MFHFMELDFPVDYDQTWRASISVGGESQSLLRIEVGSEAEGIWRARIDIRREGDNVVARVYPHNPQDGENLDEHTIRLMNLLGLGYGKYLNGYVLTKQFRSCTINLHSRQVPLSL